MSYQTVIFRKRLTETCPCVEMTASGKMIPPYQCVPSPAAWQGFSKLLPTQPISYGLVHFRAGLGFHTAFILPSPQGHTVAFVPTEDVLQGRFRTLTEEREALFRPMERDAAEAKEKRSRPCRRSAKVWDLSRLVRETLSAVKSYYRITFLPEKPAILPARLRARSTATATVLLLRMLCRIGKTEQITVKLSSHGGRARLRMSTEGGEKAPRSAKSDTSLLLALKHVVPLIAYCHEERAEFSLVVSERGAEGEIAFLSPPRDAVSLLEQRRTTRRVLSSQGVLALLGVKTPPRKKLKKRKIQPCKRQRMCYTITIRRKREGRVL